MFINYHGFNVRVKQVELSHTANAASASPLTTYTFSSQALGAAHTNRKIVVTIESSDNNASRTISSVTVGGISAGVVSDGTTSAVVNSGSGDSRIAAQWIAAVPTGTTGDIVVVFSGEMDQCAISVFRMINAATTAFHVNTDNSVSSDILSATLNIPGFGAAIGSALIRGTAAQQTVTWGGLTEVVDTDWGGNFSYSTASKSFATGQSALSVTVTSSHTIDAAGSLVVASFRPL